MTEEEEASKSGGGAGGGGGDASRRARPRGERRVARRSRGDYFAVAITCGARL